MSKSFFIISGELSGDQHGSLLMRALLKLDPSIRFFGIGGPKMEAAGLHSLFSIGQMAVMGFVEVIKHLKFFKFVESTIMDNIAQLQPQRVILIDYPGFNLRIAKKIKMRFTIPITYYISPQLWAWKEHRVEIIRKYIDQMIVIFPFEKDWYKKHRIDAEFTGHPFFDDWTPKSRELLCDQLDIDREKSILTLFPGSRRQEIFRHLKIFLESARIIQQQIKDLQIVIGLASGFDTADLKSSFDLNDVMIENKNPRAALEVADASIVASGTSTLEGTIFETPMVIVYKMAKISWWISRHFVKVPFAGMVNIIADKKIVPEFLQNDAQPIDIAKEIIKLLENKEYSQKMKTELQKVKAALGGAGASDRAAKLILENY